MRLAFCFLILLCGNLDVLRGRGQMLGIRPSSAIPIVRKSSVMTRPAASSAVLSSPQVLLQLHGRSGGQAIDDDDNDDDDDGDDDADDDGDDGSDLGSSDEEESEDGLESQGSIDEENTTPEDLAKLEAEASPSEMEKKLKLIEGAQQAALTAKMQKQEKDLQKQMRQGAAAASQAMGSPMPNPAPAAQPPPPPPPASPPPLPPTNALKAPSADISLQLKTMMETVLAPLLARESESKSTAQPPSKEDRVKRLTPVIEQILQKIEAKRDKTFKAQLKTLTAQIKKFQAQQQADEKARATLRKANNFQKQDAQPLQPPQEIKPPQQVQQQAQTTPQVVPIQAIYYPTNGLGHVYTGPQPSKLGVSVPQNGLLGQTVGTVKMENMPPPQLTEASTVGEGSLSAGQAAGSTNSESSNQLTADQLPLDEKWSLNLDKMIQADKAIAKATGAIQNTRKQIENIQNSVSLDSLK